MRGVPYYKAVFKKEAPCGLIVWVRVPDESPAGQVEALDRLDAATASHVGQCNACRDKVIRNDHKSPEPEPSQTYQVAERSYTLTYSEWLEICDAFIRAVMGYPYTELPGEYPWRAKFDSGLGATTAAKEAILSSGAY